MQNLISFPDAEKVGRGLYLVQAGKACSFAYGRTNTMMSIISPPLESRFYLHGPFFFRVIGGAVGLTQLPDVPISEGGNGGAEIVVPKDKTPDAGSG